MKKNKNSNIVYSTNPDFNSGATDENAFITPPPDQQLLHLWLERKGGGKIVTMVKDFVGSNRDLKLFGKTLRKYCGVGGTEKNGEILLQGDVRDKLIQYLGTQGYKAKKSGG